MYVFIKYLLFISTWILLCKPLHVICQCIYTNISHWYIQTYSASPSTSMSLDFNDVLQLSLILECLQQFWLLQIKHNGYSGSLTCDYRTSIESMGIVNHLIDLLRSPPTMLIPEFHTPSLNYMHMITSLMYLNINEFT